MEECIVNHQEKEIGEPLFNMFEEKSPQCKVSFYYYIELIF